MRRYYIFQLPLNNPKIFNSFDIIDKANLKDYVSVYTGKSNIENDYELCEKLFEEFNCNHPSNFAGHSLSVSDIIEIKDDNNSWFYYCDDIGFVFLNEEKEKFIRK